MNDGRVRSIAVMLDSRWYMETRATRPFETANRSQRIYARVYIYIYIYRSCHKWNRIDSIRAAFGNRFFLFFLSFFPAPPSPRPTLVCPIPVSLTNAYREYVGNFDAPRSHQVSSPRCCENPIEVGTRHEEYFENISMARRGARKTRKTLSPPPQFRSFISLIR